MQVLLGGPGLFRSSPQSKRQRVLVGPSTRSNSFLKDQGAMLLLAYFLFGPLLVLVAFICADAQGQPARGANLSGAPSVLWFIGFTGVAVTVVGCSPHWPEVKRPRCIKGPRLTSRPRLALSVSGCQGIDVPPARQPRTQKTHQREPEFLSRESTRQRAMRPTRPPATPQRTGRLRAHSSLVAQPFSPATAALLLAAATFGSFRSGLRSRVADG